MKHALRQLFKSPGFTFTAIITLALAIGACTAMFSLVNAVLLRPLPFRDPSRLAWIENNGRGGLSARTSRADVFNGWRAQNRSFESLAAYFAFSDYGRQTITDAGEPERLRSAAISDNFLSTLGISLLHGRNFTADECHWLGADGLTPRVNAVILSYGYWQRRFAGDPSVVGRALTLNHSKATVVGILPRSFDFASIFTPGNEVDIITPFPLTPETASWGNSIFGLGRLKPGVTVAQAQAELDVLNAALTKTLRVGYGFGARVTSLDDTLRGRFRSSFLLLTAAVACVLAIACVNLSNLLLARLNVRRTEFAIRIALGARRRDLIQQALGESLLLAFAGALVGVPLAIAATRALAQLETFGVPLLRDAAVDPLALIVTVGLTTLAGVACGLLPALQLTLNHRAAALGQANHQRTAGRTSATARNTLIVAEVALACILLVGAGLLFRSFHALLQVNLGFQPQRAISWRVDPPREFATPAAASAYYDGLTARVAALPGVESVGLSDCLPLGRNRTWGARAVGVVYPPGQSPYAFPRIVDTHYLQTMKIPLIAGRYFDERDNEQAPPAIIISQALARSAFPDGRNPLGQKLAVDDGMTIIGIVGNVRHSTLEQGGGPEMYLCFRQGTGIIAFEMVVRLAAPTSASDQNVRTSASLIPDVRAALAAYDPSLPNGEYYELDTLVDHAVAPRRLLTQLLGLFSGLALLLAALGLYGVISYSVVQRTTEIGIRMAIGAQRTDVVALILGSGLRLVLLGIALGLGGALLLTSLLQSYLFGVASTDPLALFGDAALLLAVATLACLLPALRATRVDPMVALRSE